MDRTLNERAQGRHVSARRPARAGSARPDLLTLQAHNPEQEEAEDQVEVSYKGEEVEIGLIDSNSSCLIHAPGVAHTRYVVMPMRL